MYKTNEELERMWYLMGVPQVADAFAQLEHVELRERSKRDACHAQDG